MARRIVLALVLGLALLGCQERQAAVYDPGPVEIPTGSVIECPNGHEIGAFTVDLHRYDTIRAQNIAWVEGQERGAMEVAQCKVCGKFYMVSRPLIPPLLNATSIHLRDLGWVP